MGKKKISEFITVTPSSTDKFLVEQADGTYKSVLASSITTGTTPDGLSSGGTITVGTYGGSGTNNDIRVAPASWYISPSNYSTAINTDFLDIALSSSGLQRYIGLYGTTSNTITKVEGSEAALATYPTTPANTIVIGYVLVNDASASTTPDLSGYLLKLDKATQATNTTGTNDTTYVTPLANAIKQNLLISGNNIKTVNGTSILGSGDLTISSNVINNLSKLSTTGAYIPAKLSSGAVTATAGYGNGTYTCQKIDANKTIIISSLSVYVTTLFATGKIRIGVYSDNNGLPGTLIQQTAELDASSTGLKEGVITSTTLSQDSVYWIVIQQNSSVIGYYFNAVSENNIFKNADAAGRYYYSAITYTGTFGSLPSTISGTPTFNLPAIGTNILLFLKIA